MFPADFGIFGGPLSVLAASWATWPNSRRCRKIGHLEASNGKTCWRGKIWWLSSFFSPLGYKRLHLMLRGLDFFNFSAMVWPEWLWILPGRDGPWTSAGSSSSLGDRRILAETAGKRTAALALTSPETDGRQWQLACQPPQHPQFL